MQAKTQEITPTETVQDRPTVRPAVDIYENQDELLLVVDLPGVPKDSIDIDIDNDTLTIVGHRPDNLPEGARVLAGQGFGFDFRRQFMVSSQFDQQRVKADLKDGVLEVRLPRLERAKPRRITIAG